MTEMAFACRYHLEAAGGLDETDAAALNRRLRRTLHNRDGPTSRSSSSLNDSKPDSRQTL